jgi:hypothetical protein
MFRSLAFHVAELFFNVFIVCKQMFVMKSLNKGASSTLSEEESSEEDDDWQEPTNPKPGKPGAKGEKGKQLNKQMKQQVRSLACVHTHAHSHIHRAKSPVRNTSRKHKQSRPPSM